MGATVIGARLTEAEIAYYARMVEREMMLGLIDPRPVLGDARAPPMRRDTVTNQVVPSKRAHTNAARGLAEFLGIPALMPTPAEQAAVAKRLRRRRRNRGIHD